MRWRWLVRGPAMTAIAEFFNGVGQLDAGYPESTRTFSA
jgi:hypothetical protein